MCREDRYPGNRNIPVGRYVSLINDDNTGVRWQVEYEYVDKCYLLRCASADNDVWFKVVPPTLINSDYY